MGTWTAFYVKAELDVTIAACCDWLRTDSNKNVVKTRGDFPEKVRFNLSGKAPRRLIVSSVADGWSEVHVNGFYTPNPAALEVSKALKTLVVDTIAQTTSDAYSLCVFDAGECVRHLEFSEFEWVTQEGAPLSNEPVPLTTNMEEEEGEDELDAFHHDEMRAYCAQVFGFEHWKSVAGREWCDLSVPSGFLSWFRR